MSRIYNTPSIEIEYCVMSIYSAHFVWGWTSQAWDPSLYERVLVRYIQWLHHIPSPSRSQKLRSLFHIFLLKYYLVPHIFHELLIWPVKLFHLHWIHAMDQKQRSSNWDCLSWQPVWISFAEFCFVVLIILLFFIICLAFQKAFTISIIVMFKLLFYFFIYYFL